MPDRAQTLSETPPILRLVPLPDPVVERLDHRPGSPYVEGSSGSGFSGPRRRSPGSVSPASFEVRELVDLCAGKAEGVAGLGGFSSLLGVDDLGGAVSQEAESKVAGLAVCLADRVEVAETVHDHEVSDPKGAGEFPLRLHAREEGRLSKEPPGLVVDDPPLPTARIGERRLHPSRSTRHHEGDEGV
jgi:hypothetical protein